MPAKPKKPRAQKTPRAANPGNGDSYTNVLLEDIRAKMQLVVEVSIGTRESLERKIDETRQELTGRIDILEGVVRQNSEDIRKNSEDIQTLIVRVDGLTERVDGLTKRVDGLTERVDGLTKRVDGLTERVDGLTETVQGLSTVVRTQNARLDEVEERVGVPGL